MKYYSWAGWEAPSRGLRKKLIFMISPVRKIHNRTPITASYVVADLDKALYTNAPRLLSGADYDTEIPEELIFDTLEEAKREVVMRVFT